jgi:hypothetical protein
LENSIFSTPGKSEINFDCLFIPQFGIKIKVYDIIRIVMNFFIAQG